jgi:hypothetical protein
MNIEGCTDKQLPCDLILCDSVFSPNAVAISITALLWRSGELDVVGGGLDNRSDAETVKLSHLLALVRNSCYSVVVGSLTS